MFLIKEVTTINPNTRKIGNLNGKWISTSSEYFDEYLKAIGNELFLNKFYNLVTV